MILSKIDQTFKVKALTETGVIAKLCARTSCVLKPQNNCAFVAGNFCASNQGTLTKRKRSVQLTSSLKNLYSIKKN
jgi:hypothetical protein